MPMTTIQQEEHSIIQNSQIIYSLYIYIIYEPVAFKKNKNEEKSLEETESYACQIDRSLRLEYLKMYMNKYYKLPLALFIVKLEAISLFVWLLLPCLTTHKEKIQENDYSHALHNNFNGIILFFFTFISYFNCCFICDGFLVEFMYMSYYKQCLMQS